MQHSSKTKETVMQEVYFTNTLLQWFHQFGRKDLPWQHPRNPYRIWVSEIMLQQTQVKTVIPYFERFMARFPELRDLANAPEEEVLALWSGLGYYSRARYLYQTAQQIQRDYQGIWPTNVEILTSFPGIGRSTAAAITSLAFNQPTAILDGNVKRVLCRYFMVEGYPEDHAIKTRLWKLAESCMQTEHCADYTQAIMDLGATCCTSRNPHCHHCPLQQTCLAYHQNRVLEFPFKKIKKKIPTRQQQFLLIYKQNGEVYLKKNPPNGIWGSLWCLPHIDCETDPRDYLQQLNKQFTQSSKLLSITPEFMNFKHTFSHFHLKIQVTLLEVDCIAVSADEKWVTAHDISHLGLPKPVKHIITEFYNR